MPEEPIVTVGWGIPGVAPAGRFLPAETPRLVEYLRRNNVRVEAPDFSNAELARPKDAIWILPILEFARDSSLALIAALLIEFIKGTGAERSEGQPRKRVRLVVRLNGDGPSAREITLEGTPDEVAHSLDDLNNAS